MGYYEDGLEWQDTAKVLEIGKKYRGSVYMSCLSVECFLKSRVEPIDPINDDLEGHNSVNLYKFLKKRYPNGKNLMSDIRLCRKYHNESRYSNLEEADIYNKDFANRFIKIVADVKEYIDNECVATIEDLENKYKK